MDGKWNDKWEIMVRKWMKDMSISDGKMDNSRAQHIFLNGSDISTGFNGPAALACLPTAL